MISYRCKNCIWFDQQHATLAKDKVEKNYGYCRKHKPIIVGRGEHYYGCWPLTDVEDLCGEFKEEVKDGLPI